MRRRTPAGSKVTLGTLARKHGLIKPKPGPSRKQVDAAARALLQAGWTPPKRAKQ